MTDKVQKIREKVVEMVNSINPFIPDEDGKNSDYEAGKLDVASKILQVIDSLQKEPVSEDLDEASVNYAATGEFLLNGKEIIDFQLEKAFKAGAEWGKNQAKVEIQAQSIALAHGCSKEEPVSEDLEDAAYNWVMDNFGNPKESLFTFEQKCFKAGAEWQKKQDQSTIELAEDHAMLAGMEKMKEEMMKNAVDAVVETDANGLACINVDGVDVGDKVKVIVIKEDKDE